MELFIYDDIGPDWLGMVSSKYVVDQLAKAKGEPLTVRINSPGGDVNEAMGIYNSLARHDAEVTIEIDGIAASAASYVAMAGAKIRIAENAMLMIHDPSTIAIGNSEELRSKAEVLDKHGAGIAAVYASRSKRPVDEIKAAMTAETWYSASEAVEAGLADEVGQPLVVAASIKPGRYRNTPRNLLVTRLPREQRTASSVADMRLQLARKRLT